MTKGLETFLVLVHGTASEIDPRGPEAGGRSRRPCPYLCLLLQLQGAEVVSVQDVEHRPFEVHPL